MNLLQGCRPTEAEPRVQSGNNFDIANRHVRGGFLAGSNELAKWPTCLPCHQQTHKAKNRPKKKNKTKTTTLKTKQSRGGEKKLCEKGGKMQALLAFWSG